VKARWQETTENDGKPLTISIGDGANGLVYSAKKAGALCLTGNVSVCPSGGATEITLKNSKSTSNRPRRARRDRLVRSCSAKSEFLVNGGENGVSLISGESIQVARPHFRSVDEHAELFA
jgi:hypothetical protein